MIRHVLPPTSEQLDAARRVVADHLAPTPTVTIALRDRPVSAKLESLQVTGAFKIRGALAAVDAARRDDPHGAVVTASAGNHGLGMALAEERSIRYISAFNDTNVIAGQATVFDEMLLQVPGLERVVVPVGGGGLISGVLMAREEHRRGDIRVSGVQPAESCAMYHVLRGTAMSDVRHGATIADGLAGGGDEGAVTNELIARHQVPIVLVSEIDIRRAVREAAEVNGLVLEGSAVVPYAAITGGLIDDATSRIGFIASGRNIATELLIELLAAPLT